MNPWVVVTVVAMALFVMNVVTLVRLNMAVDDLKDDDQTLDRQKDRIIDAIAYQRMHLEALNAAVRHLGYEVLWRPEAPGHFDVNKLEAK